MSKSSKEKTLTIKFSHDYYKLPARLPFKAKLIQLIQFDKALLSKEFIEYDTKYKDGNYPLPNGMLLILVFLFDDSIIFTTIRRSNYSKFSYYQNNVGKTFECIELKP